MKISINMGEYDGDSFAKSYKGFLETHYTDEEENGEYHEGTLEDMLPKRKKFVGDELQAGYIRLSPEGKGLEYQVREFRFEITFYNESQYIAKIHSSEGEYSTKGKIHFIGKSENTRPNWIGIYSHLLKVAENKEKERIRKRAKEIIEDFGKIETKLKKDLISNRK